MSFDFDCLTPTPVTIDGRQCLVQMGNGMTGISSRTFTIDGRTFDDKCVRQTDDITKGNHFLYRMRWRDNPWSYVYIFIAEEYVSWLLDPKSAWMQAEKIELYPKPIEKQIAESQRKNLL